MKIINKKRSIDKKEFAAMIGGYRSLISGRYENAGDAAGIVALSLKNPVDWMAAAFAVFQEGKVLCAVDSRDPDAFRAAQAEAFGADMMISEPSYDLTGEPSDEVFCIGDILYSDGCGVKKIAAGQLSDWVSFNSDMLDIKGKKAAAALRNERDLSRMAWIQAFTGYEEIMVAEDPSEMENADLWIMHESLMSGFAEKMDFTDCNVLTFGESDIMLEDIRDFLVAKKIRWFNYFAFPAENWLSACREILVTGEKVKAHEIRPVSGYSISIEKEDGSAQNLKLEGRVMSVHEGEKRDSGFEGIRMDRNTSFVTRRSEEGISGGDIFISAKTVENILAGVEGIADFCICGNKVYYAEKEIISAGRIDKFLKANLPAAVFPLGYRKAPYIPAGKEGGTDLKKLEKIAVNADFDIEGNDGRYAFNAAFENKDQGMVEFERAAASEEKSGQSQKKAFIDMGTLDYSGQLAGDLPELLKLRSSSSEKIIYVDETGRREQTYRELYDRARTVAAGLRSEGLKAGDKLILQLTDNKQYIEAFWGCMLAGVIPAPLAVLDDYGAQNLNTDKLKNICTLLRQPYILTCDMLEEQIGSMYGSVLTFEKLRADSMIDEADIHSWDEGETTLLMFTSGSTGMPKGVVLTHKNIFARTLSEIDRYGFDKTLVDVNWMTLTHAAGLVWTNVRDVYLDSLQVQVKPEYILKDPAQWLDLMSEYKANVTWAPNFAYSMINEEVADKIDHGWDLSQLRYVFATAEANVAKTLRTFLRKLKPFGLPQDSMKPCFGMTETASVMIHFDGFTYDGTTDQDEFVPIGTPVKGHEFRIVDDEGNLCNEGVIGHIQGRGDCVTPGYYMNPEVNKESFTEDGFFVTGDLGYIKDNVITLTGRQKDIIIINGLNYYVQDIESVVDELPEIRASYTVATSVQNSRNEEEILILFSPVEESVLEDTAALFSIVKDIKKTVREKCNIFPTYIVPVSFSQSIRTELGKKQRNKYRQAFYRGEYDDVIQRLGMNRKTTQSVLAERWYPAPVKGNPGIIENCCVIAEDAAAAERYMPEGITADCMDMEQLAGRGTGSGYIVDLIAFDDISESISEFSYRAVEHAKLWQQQPDVSKIFVPCEHAYMLDGDEEWNEKTSVLRGLVKSFNIENPDRLCRIVDFDTFDSSILAGEMRSRTRDEEAAYRNGIRYRSYLEPLAPEDLSISREDWNGRTCVITGGLGGVGRHLALHLAKKYGMKLILIGRKELDDDKREFIGELEQSAGAVVYARADVADHDALEKAVRDSEERIGEKAQLYFHLAGQISASVNDTEHWDDFEQHKLINETRYSTEQVMDSKAAGMDNLCRIAGNGSDTFVYAFGSVNGYFGGASLGLYSMGNSYLDAYCRYHKSKGMNVTCFNWSNWKDTGISAGIPEAVLKASSKSGFESAEAQDYMNYMETLRLYGLSNVWLGIDIHNRNYQNKILGEYEKVLDVFYTEVPDADQKEKIKELAGPQTKIQYRKVNDIPYLPDDPSEIDFSNLYRNSLIKESRSDAEEMSGSMKKMAEIWKETLRVSEVFPDDDFFDLGGNSILISKLGIRIMEAFDMNVSFQELLENSTLRSLTDMVASGGSSSTASGFTVDREVLIEDSRLNVPVRAMTEAAAVPEKIENVFVTGATGFLGAFICASLVKNTDFRIYPLVRAEDKEHAMTRVRDTFGFYGLSDCFREDRIEVICGDLTKDRFGIDEETFGWLTENMHMVYHSAADVNFVSPYRKIADTNVRGTRRILSFAAAGTRKAVHQISSYVVYSAPEKADHPYDETSELPLEQTLVNAYNESKWVSDAMCGQAAEEGLDCIRYRIGTATGDTAGGHCQIRDFFWLLVKICLKVGKIPVVDMTFSLIPVDVLADTIVGLSTAERTEKVTAYTLGFDMISMDQVVEWISAVGDGMEKTDYESWISDVRDYADRTQDQSILSTLAVLTNQEWEDADVDDSFTRREMEKAGLEVRSMDLDNFVKTYRFLESTGFFE